LFLCSRVFVFNMKKSLLVTLEFPPQAGGVATYYYNVCKNLPAEKITVMAPNQPNCEKFDEKQKFAIIRDKILEDLLKTSTLTSRLLQMGLIRMMGKIIKLHNIELIQVGQILPLGTLAYLYSRRHHIPYIVYTHGFDILLPQQFTRKKILIKKIIDGAKAVVANSHFTKDELVKLGADADKIIVVHPCPNINNDEVSEWKIGEINEDYGLKNKKIILTVGRLVARKGHDLIIKALPAVIAKIPNLIYLIIGTGPYQKELEKLVNQQGLRDYVKFLGYITDNELPAFYQVCDVFAMPSRQIGPDVEGFGIAYLEANLFSKPVIGGKSGGVGEAVINGKTGLLINPNRVEEATEALIKLLTDSAYAERLGLQGMERVIEEFDWASQTEKIKEVLA